MNLFKHSVNITGIDRLIETQEKEEQIEYGKKHKLTFTPYFKKMLHNLTYSMYLPILSDFPAKKFELFFY